MLVIGLMSGTSGDGIDAALVKIEDDEDLTLELKEFTSINYSREFQEDLKSILPPNSGTVDKLAYIKYQLGLKFASAALQVIEKSDYQKEKIDLIASHGHTVRNLPPDKKYFPNRCRLQIGDISVIAEETGITTTGDFRPAEVAAGGEGAPLITYFDYRYLSSPQKNRVAMNLGGIANVTYLPAGGDESSVSAFDVGPGNMLIDKVVQAVTSGQKEYDKDGELAAQGTTNPDILQELMKDEFVQAEPPKSAGHEDYGDDFAEKLIQRGREENLGGEDLVSTVTEFTAEAAAHNCQKYLASIDEIVVSGGGSYNTTLLEMLSKKLTEVEINTTADYGVPVDAKEAIGFALLGYQTINKKTNNVPAATGADHKVIMGKIAWGQKKD